MTERFSTYKLLLIVSCLMDILGIPHVEYRLVHSLIMIDGKEQETWKRMSHHWNLR